MQEGRASQGLHFGLPEALVGHGVGVAVGTALGVRGGASAVALRVAVGVQ